MTGKEKKLCKEDFNYFIHYLASKRDFLLSTGDGSEFTTELLKESKLKQYLEFGYKFENSKKI